MSLSRVLAYPALADRAQGGHDRAAIGKVAWRPSETVHRVGGVGESYRPARVYDWRTSVVAAEPLRTEFFVVGRERAPSVSSVRAVSLSLWLRGHGVDSGIEGVNQGEAVRLLSETHAGAKLGGGLVDIVVKYLVEEVEIKDVNEVVVKDLLSTAKEAW